MNIIHLFPQLTHYGRWLSSKSEGSMDEGWAAVRTTRGKGKRAGSAGSSSKPSESKGYL